MPHLVDSEPPNLRLIDLHHMGRPQVVGAWLVEDVVIDPGPASCLARLLPELRRRPPRAIVLTHIHLDHAGASGSLAREFSDAEVWVHERGAPHLIDPGRLLASATRLYGEQMEQLWGEVLPVPADRLRVLGGGETIGPFRVAHTPGHASHHVSYLHEPSGWAFTGDVAGVRIGKGPVLAPTPPPDIDLVAWRTSLELIEAWHPIRLAITHFGSFGDVAEQLQALRERLAQMEALAREHDEGGFIAAMRELVGVSPGTDANGSYMQAMPLAQSYSGLARYLSRAQDV